MTAPIDITLRKRKPLAGRHANLFAHEIEACHQLRHWMLNLQTRIHLEKIKITRGVREQKLNGASANVVYGFRDPDCDFTHSFAQLRVVNWRRAFFDYFLMATLNRTLALTKVHVIALLVRNDLNLNVSRLLNYFFQIDF